VKKLNKRKEKEEWNICMGWWGVIGGEANKEIL